MLTFRLAMRRAFKQIAFAMCRDNFDGESGRRGDAVEGNKAVRKYIIRRAALAMLLLGPIAPAVSAQNTVETVVGGGPNNLPASKSSMDSPSTVALDGAGNLYVAAFNLGRIFRVAINGNVTVVAGIGEPGGVRGDGGPAIGASLAEPSGIAVDSAGNVFIADRTFCRIREVNAQTGTISTIAGTDTCFYSGDGGPATSADLNNPSGVALDKSGNIFIADTNNCLIRKISASTGIISTVAGTLPELTGELHCGYSGDGGSATNAKLGFPNGLAIDGSGNIIIADTTNCAVRKVSTSSGMISTVAGSASCGYSGDGAAATSAQIGQTFGVAVDASGNVEIADTANCVIRKVSASSGDISTVAGDVSLGCGYSGDGSSATGAQLNQPYGVAVDGSGDIFVADYDNSVIRKVSASSGKISTFAGVSVPNPYQSGQLVGFAGYSGDGYLATDGQLGFLNDTPYGATLVTDHDGNIFIADTANHAIREVSASTGIMTTVAGTGVAGYSGDGGPATSAMLFFPRDVAVDDSGNIYIMDSGNCLVRKITASTGIISTVVGIPPDNLGNYFCDFSGDGGPATSAELYPIDLLTPAGGVAVDGSGNIIIADTGNGVIRKVIAATGIISTVAGIPLSLDVATGDGGPATSATFNAPYAVAADNFGNIYIADTFDYAIREVMAINGNIYTVAGNLTLGRGFSGDGGLAASAEIGDVFGLFVDSGGNLFIPEADECVVREVSGTTGLISTVAGTPNPTGGYFCGISGDGGPALSALFDNPSAVAAGTSGSLLVLDNTRVRSVANLVQAPAAAGVLVPDPLAFPSLALGTSDTLEVVFSNRGSLPDAVSTVAIAGQDPTNFSQSNNCVGASLVGGGGSCVINVKFTPTLVGLASAVLTVTDAAGSKSLGLTGSAVSPPGFSPSVSTISFGNQQVSVKSTASSVMVTNNGNSALTISAIAISGTNAGDFAISGETCSGANLAVSASCEVNATFTPSTTGSETASLKFTDNAPGNPQSVGLAGTGTDFSIGIAPGSSATVTLLAGSAATYNLLVTPISGFSGTVTLSCIGAPTDSTCLASPTSAVLNQTTAAPLSVQVTTTARSFVPLGVRPPQLPFGGLRILATVLLVALASTLLASAIRFRASSRLRHTHVFATALGFLLLAFSLINCGGGSNNSSTPPSGGTPAGTYVLTVTAAAGGVTHKTPLTLIVNAAP
jgi:sugar lactone lactonase YvrE